MFSDEKYLHDFVVFFWYSGGEHFYEKTGGCALYCKTTGADFIYELDTYMSVLESFRRSSAGIGAKYGCMNKQ